MLPFFLLSYSAAVEAAALESAPFGNPISPNVSPVRSPGVSTSPYNSGHLSPASASNNSPVSACRASAPSTMPLKSGGGLGSNGGGGGNLHTFGFQQQNQYLGSGGGIGGSPTTFNSGNSISSTKGFSPTSSLSPYRNRPVGFEGRGCGPRCGTYELIFWGVSWKCHGGR